MGEREGKVGYKNAKNIFLVSQFETKNSEMNYYNVEEATVIGSVTSLLLRPLV